MSSQTAGTRQDDDARSASNAASKSDPPQAFGRYVLHAAIARGGMAQVYTARLLGAEGFNRLVAAKRLFPQFTDDPDFVAMFHDEARIASKIHHPNVVPVLDVVVEGTEVILIQEYVHGVPLDRLFKAALATEEHVIPIAIVVAIIAGVLSGLHAAHETKDDLDQPLDIVHRDVSPQNVMVSVDGIPRLLDFGIARAQSCAHVTRAGVFKGKVAYMAPEQLRAEQVTRTADVYAAGVLLWELLASQRLHAGQSEAKTFSAVLCGAIPTLTAALEGERAKIDDQRWQKLYELEPIVTRALATLAEDRYATASEMLDALLAVGPAATSIEVAQWVKTVGAEFLDHRQKVIAASEESWRSQSRIPAVSSVLSVAPQADGSSAKRALASLAHDVIAPPPISSWPVLSSPSDVFGRPPETKRSRAPWIIAGGMLFLSGLLIAVIGMQNVPLHGAQAGVAQHLELPSRILGAVTVPVAHDATVAATAAKATPSGAAPAETSTPPAARAARSYWVPKPAPPPPATTSAPAATTPPAPKLDCDPPFYFEGTKKLYKPGCI